MRALRIALIVVGTLLVVRAVASGERLSELARALTESPATCTASLAVVLIGLWGVARLLRRPGGET